MEKNIQNHFLIPAPALDIAEIILRDRTKDAHKLVWATIRETRDTHFSRTYVIFWAYNNDVEMIRFQILVGQNFASDRKGQLESRARAVEKLLEVKKRLEKKRMTLTYKEN